MYGGGQGRLSQSGIDWQRLASQAVRRRLILPVIDTLAYLREQFRVPVPAEIVQDLQKVPISNIERIEYKAKTSSPGLTQGLFRVYFYYTRYSQLSSKTGLAAKVLKFPKFLKFILGFDHLWQVPFYLIFEGTRRIWEMSVRNGKRLTRMLPQN